MGFHVVYCMASSDKVLIVVHAPECLTFDLSKSADLILLEKLVDTRQTFI